MATALVWVLVVVGGLLVAGLLFWAAARIVRVEIATLFGRALLSAFFCAIVSAAVVATVLLVSGRGGPAALPLYVRWLATLLVMILCVVILRNGFESTFPKALAVWCCALGMAVVVAAVLMPALELLGDFLGDHGITRVLALR